MKIPQSIFVVAIFSFIASPIFPTYAGTNDPTSIILQPSQQSYYSIPAGKRAKITDFKLYVDGVEHTEGFYPSTNGGVISRAAAPTKIQSGIFTVNGRPVMPDYGHLVVDGPAALQIYSVQLKLTGTVLSKPFERTISDSDQGSSVPYVACTLENTPDSATVSVTPSNTVVIPENSSGPVRVILESSVDLVTWTEALPGVYSAATTKRFFRLRAVGQ